MANPEAIEQLRADYRRAKLDEADCETNPIQQFRKWFAEAQVSDLKEPNAMTLATAADGRPSARIVLLKGIYEHGFVFYTNFASQKGRELAANPRCALTFFWAELERQVRIEGRAEKLPKEKSEAYFQTRPKASRLGALASHQSEELPSREALEIRMAQLEAQYAMAEIVPMPESWGGYLVRPENMEFWQGRRSRLHDRILYRRNGEAWDRVRLSP